MSLIDKIRKARQMRVEAGGFAFTVRRPTDMEAARLGNADAQTLLGFVVDWHGVQEIHLVPGGSAVDVPFGRELFMEWVADRPDLWGPLAEAVLAAWNRHAEAREDAAKN